MLDSMIFSIPSFVAKKMWNHKHPDDKGDMSDRGDID